MISCELHDYFEIVCLYGYQIKLVLKNQQVIEGKALDIVTSTDKREYLLINTHQEQQSIELDTIAMMQILTPNAKFKRVSF